VKRIILVLPIFIACCINAVAQTNSGYKIKTIVLDAGHGGHDSGCRGAFSREKDVTLSIVMKLGELIKKTYPGINVIYTRNTDTFIELYERANIANRNNADLFISIHCNANRSLTAYGTETWLMGLHKSEGNLEVSKRENDVILMEDNYQENYDGFDPNSPEGYIILSMNQNAHIDQSINLASKVEDEFIKNGRLSRGVKQAGFLVLWRTTMPSILIETGFLTNREEEKYLNSEKGQNEIAIAVLQAVSNYKSGVEENFLQVNAGEDDQKLMVADTSKKILSSSPDPSTPVMVAPVKSDTGSAAKTVMISAAPVVYYKIQIAASEKPINLKDSRFSGMHDVSDDKNEKGLHRYVVGNYTDLQLCQTRLATLRKKGFKDAFIVAYRDGKRVPLNELP
jgi:N-acetylmuramoyl-L-alanine amidase